MTERPELHWVITKDGYCIGWFVSAFPRYRPDPAATTQEQNLDAALKYARSRYGVTPGGLPALHQGQPLPPPSEGECSTSTSDSGTEPA